MAMRPTAVIAASIPISILAGLTLTGMVGQSLNMMTMAGLAIAVGRVVDDSISVLENMFRHIQLGEGSFEAGISAVKEVFTSVIGSTLCTIAVFVPLAVLPGLAGELFTPLAVSMSFALVMSTALHVSSGRSRLRTALLLPGRCCTSLREVVHCLIGACALFFCHHSFLRTDFL